MKLIAHRGLTQGPNKDLENNPEQILKSISQGYDCEIDFWIIDRGLWLGHDGPQYSIRQGFLDNNYLNLWIHAKNLDALYFLTGAAYTYFWHENDAFTLTSNRYVWTYPGKELTNQSICVLPEWNDPEFKNLDKSCYGICSDYVEKIKDLIKY
jgi:hypothetical protein